jgi:hypothetical protein
VASIGPRVCFCCVFLIHLDTHFEGRLDTIYPLSSTLPKNFMSKIRKYDEKWLSY